LKKKTDWVQTTFAVADNPRAAAAVHQLVNLVLTWRAEKASTCPSLDLMGNQVLDSSLSQEHWTTFVSGGKEEVGLAFSCFILSKRFLDIRKRKEK